MKDTPKIELIKQILEESGEKTFRLAQIRKQIYQSSAASFDKMTDISLGLRQKLSSKIPNLLSLTVATTTNNTNTQKILFLTANKHPVETVFMDYNGHTTICISTHSGCPLGCEFCATGKMPSSKSLNVDEITDQILHFVKLGKRPDNIVIMGMGEPLINPDIFNVLDVLTSKDYFGYGQRHISISTVGIVPNLIKLNKTYPQINLAFSMHSPFDEEREKLMPINKAYPLDDVFSALNKHVKLNKRKIFVSYIMLKNVNDSDSHANEIARLINKQGDSKYLFHVNLIKFHKYEQSIFTPSDNEKIRRFSIMLKRLGINNTIRKDFGEEIKGACGQLAGSK
ncbi:radical SAM protein [candidate division WWE3 bacterium]|uniref:Radical SAM protein n=1 Tax=candidate division WWE3 bacterium TaxID=2053526 RepID=A0A7X9DKG0_UNCKA|nr:radical SAM protein [candidate division WWE3 bacterium]